jgi:hypothetical protein
MTMLRGDCSDRAAQRPGVQLAPHQPPTNIHLEGNAWGSRRHGDTGEPLGIEDHGAFEGLRGPLHRLHRRVGEICLVYDRDVCVPGKRRRSEIEARLV